MAENATIDRRKVQKQNMMEMTFKLEVFEGPLDLLLHLIDINKIDIYDIPISLITDQYMAYICLLYTSRCV